MIMRLMNQKERQEYSWKYYPLDITAKTTKQDIINFTKSKLIKTIELDQGYPIYIDTLTNDIILITKEGEKIFTRYNHIYKGNKIYIEINGKWETWSKAKKNITKIYFMDYLIYHEKARTLWSEKGFSFIKFYSEGIKERLINELLEIA